LQPDAATSGELAQLALGGAGCKPSGH